MDTEGELVSKCLNHELAAQTEFYNLFASKMYGICLRYAGNKMEAEDILQNGFLRVFSNLHQFHFNGSLEGWVKRTMINAAVNFCKHNTRYFHETDLYFKRDRLVHFHFRKTEILMSADFLIRSCIFG